MIVHRFALIILAALLGSGCRLSHDRSVSLQKTNFKGHAIAVRRGEYFMPDSFDLYQAYKQELPPSAEGPFAHDFLTPTEAPVNTAQRGGGRWTPTSEQVGEPPGVAYRWISCADAESMRQGGSYILSEIVSSGYSTSASVRKIDLRVHEYLLERNIPYALRWRMGCESIPSIFRPVNTPRPDILTIEANGFPLIAMTRDIPPSVRATLEASGFHFGTSPVVSILPVMDMDLPTLVNTIDPGQSTPEDRWRALLRLVALDRLASLKVIDLLPTLLVPSPAFDRDFAMIRSKASSADLARLDPIIQYRFNRKAYRKRYDFCDRGESIFPLINGTYKRVCLADSPPSSSSSSAKASVAPTQYAGRYTLPTVCAYAGQKDIGDANPKSSYGKDDQCEFPTGGATTKKCFPGYDRISLVGPDVCRPR